jgi:ribulose-5-phosphate 4-epimerase/fuculose-1-phosphate aldolase
MSVPDTSIVASLIPVLSPAVEVAVLARVLWREGYDDHDAGHLTVRQPDGTLLTVPLEVGWNEVRASDVIRIDLEGRKIEGRWSVPPAIGVHLEYHRVHPECAVTVHQHPRYATVWSTAGRLPPVYDQRAATLSDTDYALYDDYDGLFEDVESVRRAVKAMGTARCTLLRNHGVFVVGDSVAQVYTNALTLEWRARQAWFVEAIGGGGEVPDYGRTAIETAVAGRGGVIPCLWEWAVRREIGPAGPVFD